MRIWTLQEERFALLQHRDSATDFDPARFRLYASGDGRWQSPDPAGRFSASAADPQSFNRYAYVQNNPARGTDPTGLYTISVNVWYYNPSAAYLANEIAVGWNMTMYTYETGGGNYCGNGFPCGPGPTAASSPMSACYRHNADYDPTICAEERAAHDLTYAIVQALSAPSQPVHTGNRSDYLKCMASEIPLQLFGNDGSVAQAIIYPLGFAAGAASGQWELAIPAGTAAAIYYSNGILRARAVCTQEVYGHVF